MIYVECKPDWVLVTSLLKKTDRVMHLGNKSEVCKRLKKTENCIGMVDEDPESIQPKYLEELELECDLNPLQLKVLNDRDASNRLILLRPRLEEWIIGTARKEGFTLETFGLSSNPKTLHSIINLYIMRFKNLVEVLKTSEPVRTLKRLLERSTI